LANAVLVFLQVDFLRRHDLAALRNFIQDDWEIKTIHPDLSNMIARTVEARYPVICRKPLNRTLHWLCLKPIHH